MMEEKTFWADTEFFGLLGSPVRKSLSPAMHNANFRALGMNALYTPYEVTEATVGHVIPALETLRFKGLNVTMPLKQKIIGYLDELDEIASMCKAVNTVYWGKRQALRIEHGRPWFCHRTQRAGSVRSVRQKMPYFRCRRRSPGSGFRPRCSGSRRHSPLEEGFRERKTQKARRGSQHLPLRRMPGAVQRRSRHTAPPRGERTDHKCNPFRHGAECGHCTL